MQCTAKTQRGKPCRLQAMRSADKCVVHMGRARGPDTIITDELIDRLSAMLAAGNYLDVALRAAGISNGAYRKWMLMGKSPKHPLHQRFRERVETAQALGEARNVTIIADAARNNWQAAAWLLERTNPDRWARASQRRTNDVGPPPSVTLPDDPFAEVDELAARRRSA